jgi:alkanesulfonate monooxygenase SsuD/methylene tetrahydromethanopterin reductase-like flavin-dependent oxidoreductase (luciferase family)
MNEIQFGVFLVPDAGDSNELREKVRAAEDAGFDYVSIQDHPYVPRFLDTLTLIAHLAALTDRLRFMTNVANLPLRPAPMLAKASATIDLLSGGRFELGLGGGRAWNEIAGLGGPTWSPAETVAATSEAIDTIRMIWQSNQILDQPSGHYPLTGAHSGPPPAHQIGIWLGAARPRMLDLLGGKADGWVAPLSTGFEENRPAQDRIDAAARAAGRQPGDIRRVIQLVGSVTDAPGPSHRPRSGPGNQPIHTTPERWAQIIAEFATEERFDTVNLIPQPEAVNQIERFATTVIPRVRDALAT